MQKKMERKKISLNNLNWTLKSRFSITYDEVSSDCQNIRNNFFMCFPKQAHLVNLTYIS